MRKKIGCKLKKFTAISHSFLQFQEGGYTPKVLQFVESYLWSNDWCNEAYEDYGIQIDPSAEICAYYAVF